ncbi:MULTISPECIES: ABC transporter ATP-binding protein [unclassified Marinitoga]|uniref:ABC transporter ATP-binding protein n=1 Tax=unclassified Marinitoga TaxID=2640159 RepID=UPI0009509A19|nr:MULTISPECIES: ABC transporter ATP-binding protein [unclassified Marinitoga]APT76139.1 multidrug ABC transporter ATP-binding protein [Marinitoga sp. 1137]NUU97803.1 multidrug ABC transporter ATP-binding protein [Marinitoga sp. 1138]
MILKVDNLVKKYGTLTAVNNVSFEIEKGEIFGLIGPNGAGKTSIIKCILDLRWPDSGKIYLNGKVAYLPEKKNLYKSLTVKKMIEINNELTENFSIEKAYELLDKFQIAKNTKISNLSHGMLTQVYVILTFSQDADLYILDEPTWGLDPLMRNTVLEIIRESSYQEKSILYTSHILSEVEKIADRVAIMSKGKILELDYLDNIKTKYTAISLPKNEKTKGYLWKKLENENIWIVKNQDGEPVTIDEIFEAVVKGEW